MPESVPLTTHLTSLSTPRPYSAATEHPFLTAAGTGVLSLPMLSLYLSQDRLYAAHAYPRFLGHLLTRVRFSSTDAPDSPAEQLNNDIVDMLAFALQNVRREVGMFAKVERTYGLRFAQWRERKATRDYTAEMARVGALGSIEDGLVFLWAMERVGRPSFGALCACLGSTYECMRADVVFFRSNFAFTQVYLDAWKYVKSLLPYVQDNSSPAFDAIKQLVENWTCDEFEKFVDDIASLVNRLHIIPGTPAFSRAEEIWARVVELEEAFWPVEEDVHAILETPTT